MNGSEKISFHTLGIDESYIEILQNKEISEPARIQREAIPPISEGKDVIVHSGTGTGKTLAYVLPLLAKIDLEARELQGLIIVPTQELAMQIVREIESLVGTGKVAALIGGASLQRQIDKLKSHQPIAVGTPGRLVELVKLRKLKFSHVRHVVIDEVDQVFSLGASGDMETLLFAVPKERQLLFVTATVTEQVERTARRWMKEPITVRGETQAEATEAVTHEYVICERRDKIDFIRRLVRTVKPASALIFVKDSEVIGELESKLKFAGLQVESLYGDAGKQERATVMQRFAAGKLKLLIATDVAARGIDVTRISHVINFEPPIDPQQYIHRSGRTGRMGRSGTVITLTTFGERAQLTKLAARLKIELKQKTLSHGEWTDAGRRGDRSAMNAAPTAEKAAAGASAASTASAAAKPAAKAAAVNPAAKARAASSVTKTAASPSKDKNRDRERERQRDKKNKGAPRWLKEKKNQVETEN